jgi:hypothetical protein
VHARAHWDSDRKWRGESKKNKAKNTHAVRTEGGVQVVGEELVLDGLELRHFQAETEPVLAVQFKMFFALAV